LPKGIPASFPRRKWTPIGLNELFRVCRYQPGGYFLPHHDGGFHRNDEERSIQTCMLYLNDTFEGGPTNFYSESQRHYKPGDSDKVLHTFRPRAGDAIIFNSAITHDGGRVKHGLKYILRSEVMYSSSSGEKPALRSYEPDHDSAVDFELDPDFDFDF